MIALERRRDFLQCELQIRGRRYDRSVGIRRPCTGKQHKHQGDRSQSGHMRIQSLPLRVAPPAGRELGRILANGDHSPRNFRRRARAAETRKTLCRRARCRGWPVQRNCDLRLGRATGPDQRVFPCRDRAAPRRRRTAGRRGRTRAPGNRASSFLTCLRNSLGMFRAHWRSCSS